MTRSELHRLILFAAALSSVTMGASPEPRESEVIISEFMANKGSSLAVTVEGEWVRPDWIEIYNGTAQTVNLDGWYLTDSRGDLTKWRLPRIIISRGQYQVIFASEKDRKYTPGNYPYFDVTHYHTNFELDRDGEYLLVVKNKVAFSAAHSAAGGAVQIFEWGPGSLANGGERIQLSKPGDQVEGVRSYIRVDRVNYSDGSHPAGQDPWPAEADGGGKSLTREVPSDYGNDPANWIAATPSPGR